MKKPVHRRTAWGVFTKSNKLKTKGNWPFVYDLKDMAQDQCNPIADETIKKLEVLFYEA